MRNDEEIEQMLGRIKQVCDNLDLNDVVNLHRFVCLTYAILSLQWVMGEKESPLDFYSINLKMINNIKSDFESD